MRILNWNNFRINENMQQAKALVAKLGHSEDEEGFQEIKKILDPNFGYMPVFIKFHYRDKISISRIGNMYDMIKTYSQLLKNVKINPSTYDKFETLDDDINKAIIHNENLKFARSFISNKYAHLLNEDNIRLFGEIRKYESKHEKIEAYLIKKIAGFKDPQHFGEALQNLLNSLAGKWDMESMAARAESEGGVVVYKHNQGKWLIIKVPNFAACKRLGSSSWCIARSASYFNSYVATYGIQYIVYNFSKNSGDAWSMIGATVNTAAHDKSDNNVIYGYGYGNRQVQVNGLPADIVKRLVGPKKEDVLNMISQGFRPNQQLIGSMEITNQEIESIVPTYFKTLKDMKIGEQSIEDIQNFLKTRRLGGTQYSKFILGGISDATTGKEVFFKLMDGKVSKDTDVIQEIEKKGWLQEYIDRYIDKVGTLGIIQTLYKSDIDMTKYDVSGVVPLINLMTSPDYPISYSDRKAISDSRRWEMVKNYANYIEKYFKKYPTSLTIKSISAKPAAYSHYEFIKFNWLRSCVSTYGTSLITPYTAKFFDFSYIQKNWRYLDTKEFQAKLPTALKSNLVMKLGTDNYNNLLTLSSTTVNDFKVFKKQLNSGDNTLINQYFINNSKAFTSIMTKNLGSVNFRKTALISDFTESERETILVNLVENGFNPTLVKYLCNTIKITYTRGVAIITAEFIKTLFDTVGLDITQYGITKKLWTYIDYLCELQPKSKFLTYSQFNATS